MVKNIFIMGVVCIFMISCSKEIKTQEYYATHLDEAVAEKEQCKKTLTKKDEENWILYHIGNESEYEQFLTPEIENCFNADFAVSKDFTEKSNKLMIENMKKF